VTKPADTSLKAGDKVGQLTLLKYIPGCNTPPRRQTSWQVKCDCGVIKEVRASNLVWGRTKTCGHDLEKRRAKVIDRLFQR
jgi:hypothetical protein